MTEKAIQPSKYSTALEAVLSGAVIILSISLFASIAKAECKDIDAALRKAIGAGDVGQFEHLHGKVLAEPTCNGAYRARVGRVLALASLKRLQAQPGGLTAGNALTSLEKAKGYGQPWQVMMALGDAYYGRKEWGNAVGAYEAAINDIRDTTANPKAPGKDVEVYLRKRAYQARALSPNYVATRAFRGKPGGLASPNFRNFTAETVPVPVRFEYDKSALTPAGLAAVEDIYNYLQSNSIPKVRLIGHTDSRGKKAYNRKLSLNRARAAAAHLQKLGYQGKVEAIGKGEAEPFQPDDAGKYTKEEKFAFDRRVEYQVNY